MTKIKVPHHQHDRLRKLHFRQSREAKAGNFLPGLSWKKLIDLFRSELELDINQAFKDRDRTISVTYTAEEFIGWASTLDTQTFNPDEVEHFHLNRRATGLRFKTNCGPEAPLTREVTFIISIPSNGCVGLIQSIYPGRDIGELAGYVSARELVVFFDFEHPGEALIDA